MITLADIPTGQEKYLSDLMEKFDMTEVVITENYNKKIKTREKGLLEVRRNGQ